MVKLTPFMRSLHLYTGLFLGPWFLVYATSGFVLNHNAFFIKLAGMPQSQFEPIREETFSAPGGFPGTNEAQAKALLQHLELEGPHVVARVSNAQRLIVLRMSGGGNYRVTWTRASGDLVVERQRPFRYRRLLHFLHFRSGYRQPYLVSRVWALMVDAVTISMWLWVVSGIYLWAKMPRKRWAGVICIVGGTVLFLVLVILMAR